MKKDLRSLIHEVGGEDALYNVLLEFYQAMSTDTMIGFFFTGKDLAQVARKQQEFILKAAGLRENYEGKNPANAHLALPPILAGHFDRRLKVLEETLRKKGLQEPSVRTWISFENAFRAVVQK